MPVSRWLRRLGIVLLAASFGLPPGGPARSAEDFTIENVTVEIEGTTYRLPRIEVTGSELPRSDFAGLFATGAPEGFAIRVERLGAASIVIPELIVEQEVGDQRQVTTYRSIRAEDIRRGSVRRATSTGGTIAITGGGPGPQNGSFGRLTLDAIDLPQAARVAAEKGGPEVAKKVVYGAFSLDDLKLDSADGSGFGVARLAGSDARARPLREPWNDAVAALAKIKPEGDVAPEERARAFAIFADLLDASSIGAVEATGMWMKLPPGPGSGEIRVARAAYAGGGAGAPGGLRLEGIGAGGETVRVRIDALSFADYSFAPTRDGLQALSAQTKGPLSPAELRRLVPTIGTIRLTGLSVEERGGQGAQPGSGPALFGIRDVEFSAGPPVGGIPTTMRIGFSGLTLPVPADAKDDPMRRLRAMGYAGLDLSSMVSAVWNEAASELRIVEISASGRDMGQARLTGLLGNVTREAFSLDAAVALVAMLGATAKSAELTVADEGLAERVLAQEAASRGKSADELRRDWGVMAAVGVPPMLGNGPAAKAIGQALARFVAKPGRLTVSARAKDAEGLGIADVTGVREPAAVLDRLEVSATAD